MESLGRGYWAVKIWSIGLLHPGEEAPSPWKVRRPGTNWDEAGLVRYVHLPRLPAGADTCDH